MEYGDCTDWLLCLGIAVLLAARLPMRNREGHSPKYWRKHLQAAQNQPAIPIAASENRQLNKGDTWTILGVLLGVLFVIIVPPLYAKIPIFAGVCVGLGWLAYRSHWVIGWTVVQKTFLGMLVIVLCSAIAVPQFWSQWRSEQAPTPVSPSPPAPTVPSLEWRPLAVTAALGKDFNLDYDDKSPSDLILVFEGAVVNSGAPSSTFKWEAKLVLPDDTVPVLGYLLVSPPTNPTATWSLRTPDGHKSPLIPFRQGSLPESTASKAIAQGDSQTGFAIFAFHGLQKKWFKPKALNGAKVTISFYDTAKRQTVYDWVLPDQHGQFMNDITSEKTPGMPTPQ